VGSISMHLRHFCFQQLILTQPPAENTGRKAPEQALLSLISPCSKKVSRFPSENPAEKGRTVIDAGGRRAPRDSYLNGATGRVVNCPAVDPSSRAVAVILPPLTSTVSDPSKSSRVAWGNSW